MPLKNYFDFSIFDEAGDAMDLFANTIRKSFKYDSLEGKYEFDAIVLTQPIPMSLQEADTFFASPPEPPVEEDVGWFNKGDIIRKLIGGSSDEIPKFTFKARVIGPNSPHLFLPDPCDTAILEELGQQQKAQDIIDMHTTVIAAGATEKPKKGDIVRIRFEPGTFKIDMQTAQFVRLRTSNISGVSNLLGAQKQECAGGALKAFKAYFGEKINPSTATYISSFDPSIGPLTSPTGRFEKDDGDFYSKRRGGNHNANDFIIRRGKPLYATHDGIVKWGVTRCEDTNDNLKSIDGKLTPVACKDCGGQPDEDPNNPGKKCPTQADGNYSGTLGGNSLTIKHADGWYTFYGHLSPTDYQTGWIPNGTKVKAGDFVAFSGNTGNVQGDHLHLQLHAAGGALLNPILHFDYYFEDSKKKLEAEKSGASTTGPAPTTSAHTPAAAGS